MNTKGKGAKASNKTATRIKPTFKSLNDLFNFSNKTKYDVKTIAEYKKLIKQMNIGDLQTHAVKLGLKPSRNRAMLEKTLLNTFSKYKASMVPPETVSPTIKNSKQVMEILSRGA
jgi:hypothetical protein